MIETCFGIQLLNKQTMSKNFDSLIETFDYFKTRVRSCLEVFHQMILYTKLNMFEFATKYFSYFDKKSQARNWTRISQLLAWHSNWLSHLKLDWNGGRKFSYGQGDSNIWRQIQTY